MKARPNRLAEETSPYLLQHAHNPVDWYPWGEAALQRARDEDKPILLSIGYSACHWCHVMAHESFEDEEIAALMNRLFINIKVDREERPDLDRIYQLAHQLLTERGGGWPLTMFLTPDQTPFFGGTYFPKSPRHGLPGFADVLQQVERAYRQQGSAIAEQNRAVHSALQRIGEPQPLQAEVNLAAAAREALERNYDAQFGGFGDAPKFPQPTAVGFLLRRYARSLRDDTADREALNMACTTLRRMALGGIYDQVGGGFMRYAVDRQWMIPHFEKMLYDNALLLGCYADAYHATGDTLFRRIAAETGHWLTTQMQSAEGGFYAALDADSGGIEGGYYLWDCNEVDSLLNADEQALVHRRFGLNEAPNFEGYWHFHVHASFSELAKALRRPKEDCVALWESARQKLAKARARRQPPGCDDKVITAWNALAVAGLARAGRALGEQPLIDAADRAASFLGAHLWHDGRLHATSRDGRLGSRGFLDDHAYLLDALLELLQARWSDADLAFARVLADQLLARFQDTRHGGFLYTADDHEDLIHRPRPVMDDALPAPYAVACLALERLGHLCAEPRYSEAAERGLAAAKGDAARAPHGHCSLLVAADESEGGTEQVLVTAQGDHGDELIREARRYFAPHRQVYRLPKGAGAPGVLPDGAEAGAWVCREQRCLPPVTDTAGLRELLVGR